MYYPTSQKVFYDVILNTYEPIMAPSVRDIIPTVLMKNVMKQAELQSITPSIIINLAPNWTDAAPTAAAKKIILRTSLQITYKVWLSDFKKLSNA